MKADVLKLGPQSRELDRKQESGSGLEEPVGMKGAMSEENQHGHWEMDLEVFCGQGVGF